MSEIKVNKVSPRSGTGVTLGDSGDTITVPSGATLDTSNSTVTLPDNSVTTAKINNEAVTPAKLGYDYNQFRNIIINGDMSIAQRGTSATGLTGSGYNTCDRWRSQISSAGTWSQSQSTEVPSGQGFATSYKWDCTTADASLAAGDSIIFQQRVEAQFLQYLKKGTSNAESLTLSFWVRSNKTGTYIANLYDENNRNISKAYTISAADTWEKKTLTFAGDTSGAFGNDNAIGLYVQFFLAAGSNYTSGTLATSWESYTAANQAVGQVNLADSTSNEWFITGVQLEAGTTASDFEFLPHDVNLQRCQSYYYVFGDRRTSGAFPIIQQHSIGTGITHYLNQMVISVTMKVNMRAVPSIDQTSGTDFFQYYHGTEDNFDSFTGISSNGQAQMIIRNTNQISASIGEVGIVYVNGTDAYTAFDSEL